MRALRGSLVAVTIPAFLFAATAAARADPPTVLYRLSGSSGFLSGCIEGPCLCPVSLAYMAGTFGLTLDPTQGPDVYAIDEIDWFTHWNGEVRDVITGSGSYFLDGENHRILLELQVNGGSPILLDSGFVVRGSEFPAVAISALTDDFCFQEGVSIDAAPSALSLEVSMASPIDVTWNVVPDATSYDVVQGSLTMLRAGGGAYDEANTSCTASAVYGTSVVHDQPLEPGEVVWFLVRAVPEPGYDSGGVGQAESREEEIDRSPNSCP